MIGKQIQELEASLGRQKEINRVQQEIFDKFVELVYQLRTAQKNFFSTHANSYLAQSKRLEAEVDEVLAKIKHPQPDLFGDSRPIK